MSDVLIHNELDISDYLIIKDKLIHSPLEPGDFTIQIKNQIIELLGYNLIIHYVMIYLILMGIIILSLKVICYKNLSFDCIKNNPGGILFIN